MLSRFWMLAYLDMYEGRDIEKGMKDFGLHTPTVFVCLHV
ncbi:unnamed protein product [Arabidopsis lyrata]|nr:unnamed protein product [Arabidopsis lyrata]